MNKDELEEHLYSETYNMEDKDKQPHTRISIDSVNSSSEFIQENSRLCTKNYKKLLTVVIIFGLVFGWSIVSIVSLVVNPKNELQEICPGNWLWDYLVIMIVLNNLMAFYAIYRIYKNHYNNTYCKFGEVCACIFIQLFIVAIGIIVLHHNCIEIKLKHSFIYTSIASWILWQGIIILAAVLITVVSSCLCGTGGV